MADKMTDKVLNAGTDAEITEYIRSIRFKKKLMGIDEEDLWIVVSNIQKYYEKKALEAETVIETLRKDGESKDQTIAKLNLYIEAMRRKNDAE